MAIAVTSPQSLFGFIKNATSADASGCEEIIAATVGKSIKIKHLSMSNNSAGTLTVTIGEGKTGSAVTTALIGPVTLLSGQTIPYNFNPELILTVSTALTVDASGSGAINIFAQGNIE